MPAAFRSRLGFVGRVARLVLAEAREVPVSATTVECCLRAVSWSVMGRNSR
jgi:hypothetical protein